MLFDQNRVDAIIHNWKNQVFSNETIPGVPQRHSTCLKPPNGGFWNLASSHTCNAPKSLTMFEIPVCLIALMEKIIDLMLLSEQLFLQKLLRWCRCERQKKEISAVFSGKRQIFFLPFTPAPSQVAVMGANTFIFKDTQTEDLLILDISF